jgi:hypothetical protein
MPELRLLERGDERSAIFKVEVGVLWPSLLFRRDAKMN